MGDSHEGIEERHPTKSTPLRGDPEEELRRFVAQAREMGARAVVLFGSRAIEQHTESSDADVCVIAGDLCRGVATGVRWLAENVAHATWAFE